MDAETEKPSTVAEALPAPLTAPTVHVVDPTDELLRFPLVGFTVPSTPAKVIGTPVGFGRPKPVPLFELVLTLAVIAEVAPLLANTEVGDAVTFRMRFGLEVTDPEMS